MSAKKWWYKKFDDAMAAMFGAAWRFPPTKEERMRMRMMSGGGCGPACGKFEIVETPKGEEEDNGKSSL
jgi:hypothetical protein